MCRNGEKNITGGEKAIRSKQSLEIDIEREIASAHGRTHVGKGYDQGEGRRRNVLEVSAQKALNRTVKDTSKDQRHSNQPQHANLLSHRENPLQVHGVLSESAFDRVNVNASNRVNCSCAL